ncbi:glycosyltransferase family 9 protein [Candidatus Woesearchaeota archaeon]|nr:glycosyltransferase family 9 protein [Candidatus Woesearchaeota archaeon]
MARIPEIPWTGIRTIALANFIPGTVGDSLYIIPVARRLKKAAPHARIILTGTSQTREVLGDEPAIDEFVEITELADIGKHQSRLRKGIAVLRVLYRMVRELRKRKPDMCFVGIPNFAPYHLVPLFAGIPLRFGFKFPGSVFNFTLTASIPFRNPITTGDVNVHLSEANLDVLKLVGLPISAADMILRRNVSDAELQGAHEVLDDMGVKKPLIVFQAGAKGKNRQWPAERFSSVGKDLVRSCGAHIILAGSPAEWSLCERIRLDIGEGCTNLAGKVPFGTLAGLLSCCDLVLGNDSGLMHLAASVGAQTAVLFGSPNPNHSRPLGAKRAIIIVPPTWNPGALFENEPTDLPSKYLLDIDTDIVLIACRDALAGRIRDGWYQKAGAKGIQRTST